MAQVSYYDQPIGRIWSGGHYDDTYRGVDWPWYNLPFADDYTVRRGRDVRPPSRFVPARSIIEVGSAMGQGYATLMKSGLVDLSGYVGYDVSEIGQALCRQRYPEATWIEGDFSRIALDRRFEYAY